MTFSGEPRDKHIYDHAHESPPVMYVPLVVLSVFAIIAGRITVRFKEMIEQARPAGILSTTTGAFWSVTIPDRTFRSCRCDRNDRHLDRIFTSAVRILVAVLFCGVKKANPADIARTLSPVYNWLKI